MRRLAAAFSRKDKPPKQDNTPATTHHNTSRSLLPTPNTPATLSRPSLVHSEATPSTCSSDFSQPKTPDVEIRQSSNGLTSWLSRRKSKKAAPSVESRYEKSDSNPPVPSSLLLPEPVKTRQPTASSQPPSVNTISLGPSLPTKKRTPVLQVESSTSDSEDSTSESDAEGAQPSPSIELSPNIIQLARKRLYDFTVASLVPAPTPPPLLQPTQHTFNTFPKSMMTSTLVSQSRSSALLSTVHKKKLLHRLDASQLTIEEQRSIAPFARPTKAAFCEPPKIPEAVASAKELVPFSPGVRKWTARRCYEERLSLWYVNDAGNLVQRDIPGPKAAVAALEFSEAIECLAGTWSPLLQGDHPVQIPISTVTQGELTQGVPHAKQPRDALPPLHIKPNMQEMQGRSSCSTAASTPSPATPPPNSKRGVRFHFRVEEADEEDLIPLAVTLQAKRQKEEQDRRIKEELLRKRKEAEDRARAEARNRKLYAEEVVASRRRREAQRTGFRPDQSKLEQDVHDLSTSKRPAYDKRNSSSSNMSTSDAEFGISHSRGSSASRRESYASSGDDSVPNSPYIPSRASSSSSVAGMWSDNRSSPTASAEDLSRGRRKHSRLPDETPRPRKLSDRSRKSWMSQQDVVPPVPFLARDWQQVQDVPIPSKDMIGQGPFMASVRSEKRGAFRASHSTERLEHYTSTPTSSPSFIRPLHPKFPGDQDTVRTATLTMSYSLGNRNTLHTGNNQHPRAFDPGRRGTVIF